MDTGGNRNGGPETSGDLDRPTRRWDELPDGEQRSLLIEYGYYQDGFPNTCSLELKTQRFRAWLRERGVDYA